MDTKILAPVDAEMAGYARFNAGPHLCVDVPKGHSTISVRTPEGRLVTFGFCPYQKGGPPQCVDVQHHTSNKAKMNGDTACPVQKLICFTVGQDTFRAEYDDEKPTTLVSLILEQYKGS